ncbi:hypothetical protein BaRGS_00037619 [Batillaria attramentaria]|uniref:Uncharacterized protein n=1 Tax=Batillaria attramentaria TaxID=370345 RepID=A0ABD0J882_9CAEN
MADKGRDNEAVGGSVSVSGAGRCQSAENDQLKKDIAVCEKTKTELTRIASEAKQHSALAGRNVNKRIPVFKVTTSAGRARRWWWLEVSASELELDIK